MFAFVPFVLSLYSNGIDFSILSITTEKGMRSLFRIKVDKEEFLLHIFWHFNWRWPELQESFQPMSETIPTTQAHIIELKEQLPEAVKIDNIKVTPSEGRMKTPHRLPQNSSTVPMPKVMPPRKERKKRS